jgi:hypothetical protein
MLNHAPLLNIKLPYLLKNVLLGFSDIKNPIEIGKKFIKTRGPSPAERYIDYGFETHLMLFNSDNTIITLCLLLLVYISLRVARPIVARYIKNKKYIKFISRRIKAYQWNGFIRFMLSAYLELSVTCILNLETVIPI